MCRQCRIRCGSGAGEDLDESAVEFLQLLAQYREQHGILGKPKAAAGSLNAVGVANDAGNRVDVIFQRITFSLDEFPAGTGFTICLGGEEGRSIYVHMLFALWVFVWNRYNLNT